jgi:hypothetical protein
MNFRFGNRLSRSVLAVALLPTMTPAAQVILLNRAYTPSRGARARIGIGSGFVGDHFRIGSSGETWVVDTIQIWAVPDPAAAEMKMGDVYERLSLFGGIESPPPTPGEPVCDCHNLMTIKTAEVWPGMMAPEGVDVQASRVDGSARQLTFRQLNWSIPGGVNIQFGVMGVGRTAPGGRKYVWYTSASAGADSHELKIFDEKGRFDGPYSEKRSPSGRDVGINVQVWGHKPAEISIRAGEQVIEVVLHSAATLEGPKVDMSSLRFGPSGAAPASSRLAKSQNDLVLQFRAAETGIPRGAVNACLDGRLLDGVPFKGCDLVKPAH